MYCGSLRQYYGTSTVVYESLQLKSQVLCMQHNGPVRNLKAYKRNLVDLINLGMV